VQVEDFDGGGGGHGDSGGGRQGEEDIVLRSVYQFTRICSSGCPLC